VSAQSFLAVLDRDGIVNLHTGYVYRAEDFQWNEAIFDFIQVLQNRNAAIYIATNQAGIGRGIFTDEDFHKLTKFMLGELESRGLGVEGVLYCPHETTINGDPTCLCRKPESGLLRQAIFLSGLSESSAVMVGDKASDMLAAERAGFQRRILVSTDPEEILMGHHTEVFDSLRQVINQI